MKFDCDIARGVRTTSGVPMPLNFARRDFLFTNIKGGNRDCVQALQTALKDDRSC